MNYPGLKTSLRYQLSESEWNVIREYIEKVDSLPWYQNDQACALLEAAATEAIEKKYYRCAAKVLYYYDNFFAAA